jgi:hypothetical protein
MFWKKWFTNKIELVTPYGVITGTKREVPSIAEEVRSLTLEEEETKETYVAGALSFASEHGIETDELNADDLDELLKRWAPSVADPDEFDAVTKTLGFAFGNHLARRYGMRWIVISDRYGVDFAVREETTRCTSFPLSVVAKRLESGERDFMGPVAFAIQKQIQTVKRSGG